MDRMLCAEHVNVLVSLQKAVRQTRLRQMISAQTNKDPAPKLTCYHGDLVRKKQNFKLNILSKVLNVSHCMVCGLTEVLNNVTCKCATLNIYTQNQTTPYKTTVTCAHSEYLNTVTA